MSTPLITVILPGKDVAPYLRTTLETLLRQFDDPAALKLVAIDDGSSDDTLAIMRQYAERFPRAEVLSNVTPVGLASARNQGLAHVEGETFCFLDADDWMQPHRLRVLVDALHDLGTDFVRTDHVTVRGSKRALVRAPYAWRGVSTPPRDAILPTDDRSMVDYPYAWAGAFHRRVLDRGLAGFAEGLFTAEDRPWIWRLHLQAESFAVVDAPYLLYRRGLSGSLSQTRDRRQLHFARALGKVIDLVNADPERERFEPKLVTSILALSSHHIVRSRAMDAGLRREMRSSITGLLSRLPQEVVLSELRTMEGSRRRVLAPVLREAGHV